MGASGNEPDSRKTSGIIDTTVSDGAKERLKQELESYPYIDRKHPLKGLPRDVLEQAIEGTCGAEERKGSLSAFLATFAGVSEQSARHYLRDSSGITFDRLAQLIDILSLFIASEPGSSPYGKELVNECLSPFTGKIDEKMLYGCAFHLIVKRLFETPEYDRVNAERLAIVAAVLLKASPEELDAIGRTVSLMPSMHEYGQPSPTDGKLLATAIGTSDGQPSREEVIKLSRRVESKLSELTKWAENAPSPSIVKEWESSDLPF